METQQNDLQKFKCNFDDTISFCLEKLNYLPSKEAILIVCDDKQKLVGSITDGDIRRALLNDFSIHDSVDKIIQPDPVYLVENEFDALKIKELREKNYKIIPIINANNEVVDILNLVRQKGILPIDVVIMAGGKGTRLRPMTNDVPKPLLKVGEKPIIDYSIDRLKFFGVKNFWITLNYKGEMIQSYLKDGKEKNLNIQYVTENKPLGTIGSISLIEKFENDTIILTNSDLLTKIDYESFYLDFIKNNADISVLAIPYKVSVPYATLEGEGDSVHSFIEKPTLTYRCNGGIYLIKKELLELIPQKTFYNATDLLEAAIKKGYKVKSYTCKNYWLDIGKPIDFEKAQEDVKVIF